MKAMIEYKTKEQHNALLAFRFALKMKVVDIDEVEGNTFLRDDGRG